MADEWLHLAPRDELGVFGVVAAKPPRQEPPQPWPQAGVDSRDAPGTIVADELHLAGLHQPRGRDVDQAPVQYVCAQQHLAWTALELPQIELGRGRARRGALQPLHPGDGHEQVTPTDARLQADHGRLAIAVIQARDDILDLP